MYCRVIARRYGECLEGEELALCDGCAGALGVEYAFEQAVLSLGGHYHGVGEVFGGSAYERYAAYVDFLDDVLLGSSRCHGGFKRIQVDNHKVDGRNGVLFKLGAVAFVVAAGEYSAEHLGVERLDASAQNRGIPGKVFYGIAGYAERFDKGTRAARGKQAHAVAMQFANYRLDAGLVEDRNKSAFYFLVIRLLVHLSVILLLKRKITKNMRIRASDRGVKIRIKNVRYAH